MQVFRAAAFTAGLLSPAIASATTCHATPGSYTDVDGDTVQPPCLRYNSPGRRNRDLQRRLAQLFAPPYWYVFPSRRRRGMGINN